MASPPDPRVALDRLALALPGLSTQASRLRLPWRYYLGEQDLPYAPPGASREYHQLRRMSVANWLRLVVDVVVQHLAVEGFRSDSNADTDAEAWRIWQHNRLDARQRQVYVDALVYGVGMVVVSPNPDDPTTPKVSVESPRNIFFVPKLDAPYEAEWAVKLVEQPSHDLATGWSEETSGLWQLRTPAQVPTRRVAYVWDETTWTRLDSTDGQGWRVAGQGVHGLGRCPLVLFPNRPDSAGGWHSDIRPLIPLQDAINTTRFNLMLAMQYAAYRQRAVLGYDPVVRDADGNPIWRKLPDGTLAKDENGQPIPLLRSPGRAGVDRLLVFPSPDTKVQEFAESDLDNYVKALAAHVEHLATLAQVPPHYATGRIANLSAEALAAANATKEAKVTDLKTTFGESWEEALDLGNRARGATDLIGSEVVWAHREARSFAATVDAVTKLIGTGFPEVAGWEMLPGATPQRIRHWRGLQAPDEAQPRAVMPATASDDDEAA